MHELSRLTALKEDILVCEKFWRLEVLCQFKMFEEHQISFLLHVLQEQLFFYMSWNSPCNSEQLKQYAMATI